MIEKCNMIFFFQSRRETGSQHALKDLTALSNKSWDQNVIC